MEALLILIVGILLAAPRIRGGREALAVHPPRGPEPAREPKRRSTTELRRARVLSREIDIHDRRLAWIEEYRSRAEAAGDDEAVRRFAALLRAEATRHELKLARIGKPEQE